MTAFTPPQKPKEEVVYDSVAPWKTKTSSSQSAKAISSLNPNDISQPADPLSSGWQCDQSPVIGTGDSLSTGAAPSALKTHVRFVGLKLITFPIYITGFVICLFGWASCCSSLIPNASPMLEKSAVGSFFGGLLVFLIGGALLLFALYLSGRHYFLFKKNIVHTQLKKRFEILFEETDSSAEENYPCLYAIASGHTDDSPLNNLLSYMNIRSNLWNSLSHNDLFVARFYATPFMFTDIILKQIVRREKSKSIYLRFAGQLLIFPLKCTLPQSIYIYKGNQHDESYSFCTEEAFEDSFPLTSEIMKTDSMKHKHSKYEQMNKISEQLRKDIVNNNRNNRHAIIALATNPSEQMDLNVNEFIEQYRKRVLDAAFEKIQLPPTPDGNNMLQPEDFVCKYKDTFKAIEKSARCEVDFAVFDNYFVIILGNAFDPFVPYFTDIFRRPSSVTKRIEEQTSWLQAIVSHVQTSGLA